MYSNWFTQNPARMNWYMYSCNNTALLSNTIKLNILPGSYMISNLAVFCLLASQPASLPAVRPSTTSTTYSYSFSNDRLLPPFVAIYLYICCFGKGLSTLPWSFV